MKTLVFLLEEPSAEEFLKGFLPGILPEQTLMLYLVFEGKQDLERRLPRILKAWQRPDCLFVVMRDQDSGECDRIKQNLQDICRKNGRGDALIRIACRELESFYLGDLAAVEQGLSLKGLAKQQGNRKFREPDRLESPSVELIRLTRGGYQKVLGSRAVAPFMRPDVNRSHSFNVLVSGIKKLVETN